MNKRHSVLGAFLLTSAAMLAACSDESSSDSITNIPIISTESSSSVDFLDPNSSAEAISGSSNIINPESSAEAYPGSSDAVIPGSSADAAPGSSAAVAGSSADAAPASSAATSASSSAAVAGSSADAAPASSTATSASSSAAVAGSSADAAPASSSEAASSNSEVVPGEKTYKFGYALKNAPRPSTGCGKNSTLVKTKSVENGDRFEMMVEGLNREYFITLPQNYDNTKPYKLLFAMHCMGSNAEDFVHHFADQDHPTPYYGQQVLDTEGNYIFVAPRGDTGGGEIWMPNPPWRKVDDKDHKFFDKLLTTMEENYCVDTSRVFVTGFSFGSMHTYSLAEAFQDRIRAVVTYAVADYNIYEPHDNGTEKQLPIAWMNVHGKTDGTCPYDKAFSSALPRVLKKNGKASDGDSQFTDASSEKPQEVGGSGHFCYDFKNVDERFPVKWCSWNGGHQWTAYDNGNWEQTWVPEEVHKFFEQF